jgi:F0F1-type ATP synthase assembly protein I
VKNPLRSNSRKKLSESPNEPPGSGYFRYTNIIYQLIGVIAIAFGIGYFFDYLFQFSVPVFKLVFSIGGIILALYLVFKELNKK